jgi:hypothetical protein
VSKDDNIFTIDVSAFRKSIGLVRKNLKMFEWAFKLAIYQAIKEYAEKFLAKAQNRAPAGEGNLRGSATVIPESDVSGETVGMTAGFNIVYAHIRDVGGEIRPVRAKALFIPLRKGARPGDKSLKWGVDFVLAKLAVQKGNLYFSLTVDEAKGEYPLWVSLRFQEIVKGERGEKIKEMARTPGWTSETMKG